MTPSAPARGIDATGTEVQLPVPTEDLVVTDGVGVPRKLFAGQPVPRDLVDAYNEATGKGGKPGEKTSGDELPDKRSDLDAYAAGLGVEEPEKLPNKEAVVDAIKAKQAESGGDS